ncbi:LytR C-terminal domain-containing protein [Arthrobacter sp. ISL-5]|uniref:LytR C-terminal domain-containing protein n=1 Tax=Arthrobacter sp. ISL-5 TaxID=2819111 RepID=UPI001BE56369|nr:LytR C-terminal domain-containing protein [Arthrobacter sp. ISL-5]MBT2552248.1 LytR C-terminal domain-containing protein [Arthrobacter sp. ISL-5]
MTNYARDEFDRVPEASARQGVHRAVSAPARARLWPILAVGIGSLAVGVFAFLLLPQLGFQASASPLSAMTSEAPPSSAPGSQSSPSATPSAGATSPSASASSTPSASESASAGESAVLNSSAVDKSQPVSVYNATLTSGLAGRVGATVEKDGWVLGEVSNWQGAPQQESVIFYSGAHKANAEALGALLNITKLVETGGLQAPVAVVLGPEFQ